MPALATYPAATPAASSDPASITTTLYDLVAALNAEVDPEDDALVTAAEYRDHSQEYDRRGGGSHTPVG